MMLSSWWSEGAGSSVVTAPGVDSLAQLCDLWILSLEWCPCGNGSFPQSVINRELLLNIISVNIESEMNKPRLL